MQTISVTEFKAHALRILATLSRSHEDVLITKRGKPLARLTRPPQSFRKPVPGRLAHTVVAEKDILSPLGKDMWNAAR